jgi:hypothetical protein
MQKCRPPARTTGPASFKPKPGAASMPGQSTARDGKRVHERSRTRLLPGIQGKRLRQKVGPEGNAQWTSTGRPAAFHSGSPSSSLRALKPRLRSSATASNDITQ